MFVTSMIAHWHGDIQYVHYGLNLYPSDLNHTMDLIDKVLNDYEDVSKFASYHIFPNTHTSPLFDLFLEKNKVCKSSPLPS